MSTREVPLYREMVDVPFISLKIKPDVSVIHDLTNQPTDGDDLNNEDKCFIFFIELVSDSDFPATIRKLSFDLTLQLIHIRSYSD